MPPIQTSVGSMPVGAGPVGYVSGGVDQVGPRVINVSPAPGSALQHPKPVVGFDVIDYEDQLNRMSVRARVNGLTVFDSGQAQRFFLEWTGQVENIPLGIRVAMHAPHVFDAGATVSIELLARDYADNRLKKSWSFTTYPATRISHLRLMSDRCVELGFTPGLRVNAEVYRPSNYAFSVRLGYAQDVYARTVTPPSDVPDAVVHSVIVCMRDYFSQNGRYSVRVQGVLDEFGRSIDTERAV